MATGVSLSGHGHGAQRMQGEAGCHDTCQFRSVSGDVLLGEESRQQSTLVFDTEVHCEQLRRKQVGSGVARLNEQIETSRTVPGQRVERRGPPTRNGGGDDFQLRSRLA